MQEPEDRRRGLSTVDTSRPFRSVKEAVAVFGERILVGEVYSPKPFTFPKREIPFFSPSPRPDKDPQWNHNSPSPRNSSCGHEMAMMTPLSETVKKLEAELDETKRELKLLKERESENEVALASLNAEIHNNKLKLAQAEAARRGGDVAGGGGAIIREEGKKSDGYLSGKTSTKLAHILSIGEEEGLFAGRKKERKVMKKKPIVPLVGNLFSWKKRTSTSSLQWSI